MIENFEESIFGEFYNRRNKATFIEMMATQGWAYFSVRYLNEMFAIMLERHGTADVSDDDEEEDKPKT